jgi:hypothetical protein
MLEIVGAHRSANTATEPSTAFDITTGARRPLPASAGTGAGCAH